ncbi:hypothetical protein FACS189437_06540 [Bacteroidia bacterium]|nr:hypothetical protein FACS189437_06540 [Bacteroidia bacterium]
MRKEFQKFLLLLSICLCGIVCNAQNNEHFPGDVILRGGVNRIGLHNIKQLDAVDFQFSYNVHGDSPSLLINGKVSYSPDYMEFNGCSLLGATIMAYAINKQKKDVRGLMYRYDISEEEAWKMYEVPEDDQKAIVFAGLLAIESASIEIPLGGSLSIEPSWSLLRFKKYKPFYSKFSITGSAGLNFNIYFSSKFLLNIFGEYNWLYSKEDPEIYKGINYGVRLGLGF